MRGTVVWLLATVLPITLLILGFLKLGAVSGSVIPNDTNRDGVHFKAVQFGDSSYRLPVDKFKMGITPYDKEHDYAAFTFNAILPDVTPVSDDPAEAAKWGKGTGWHRQIFGLVEHGHNFVSAQERLEYRFKNSLALKALTEKSNQETAHNVDLIYLDKTKFTVLPNGCRKYVGETALNADVLQVCENEGDMLLVDCRTGNKYVPIPSPSCTVFANIAEKTRLIYHYGYDYFDQALDIHRKLISLLSSFRE